MSHSFCGSGAQTGMAQTPGHCAPGGRQESWAWENLKAPSLALMADPGSLEACQLECQMQPQILSSLTTREVACEQLPRKALTFHLESL